MARRLRRSQRPAAALLAFVLAAPVAVRAAPRDFATVGRIGVRVVDRRTVVLVPIAGPMRLRLSEPFILVRRSRLILTIENARLGIGIPAARRQEGTLALGVREVGQDVQVTLEMDRLGEYELKPTEGGILLTIGPDRPAPESLAASAGSMAPAASVHSARTTRPAREVASQESGGSSRLGLLALAVTAGLAGWLVRRFRSGTLPPWVSEGIARVRRRLGLPGAPDPVDAASQGLHADESTRADAVRNA
ncbi:MAG: hypothetical protein L0271_27130 [Gemmatimonadetes bacterium]|nr:hypothetical protein [Gemmatimonadota bacterium]